MQPHGIFSVNPHRLPPLNLKTHTGLEKKKKEKVTAHDQRHVVYLHSFGSVQHVADRPLVTSKHWTQAINFSLLDKMIA